MVNCEFSEIYNINKLKESEKISKFALCFQLGSVYSGV